MATEKTITMLVGEISARGYPNAPFKDSLTVKMWLETLGDVPDDALQMAMRQYASEDHEFGPNPGKLRAMAVALLQPDSPPAAEGWHLVLETTHLFGADQFEKAMAHMTERNPLAAQAIKQLGWYDWCMSDVDHQMSWRKQFMDCYTAYAKRQHEAARELPDVTEFKRLAQAERAKEIVGGLAKKLAAPSKEKK